MSVVVITAPASDITVADAKAHLNVDFDDDDALIGAMVAAAVGALDGPAGWLGRSVWLQTLELSLDGFPAGCGGSDIALPFGPVVDVVSVKYDDANGAEQTLSSGGYVLTRAGVLTPAYGASWPATRAMPDSVRVRYRAGHVTVAGETVTQATPAPIRAAVLLMVGDLYQNRETTVSGTINARVNMSTTVEALLSTWRQWGG